MTRLAGKCAVVTGGRQGIGRAIVEAFLTEGADVLTCGRGERPDDLPSAVRWAATDMAAAEDVEKLLAAATSSFGEISILVNNAGVQVEKTVADSTDADWDLVIGANCRGVFACCRAAIPMMRPGGSIIKFMRL